MRAQGFATAFEELEVGAAAAAAVLHDAGGEAVGAICVGGPAARLTRRRLTALGKTLKERAAALSRQLERGRRLDVVKSS